MANIFKRYRAYLGKKYSAQKNKTDDRHAQIGARAGEASVEADAPMDIANDTLGFGAIATRLSPRISDLVPSNGSTVIGIEGKWGSGKTTLLNAICGHPSLKTRGRLKVIHIAPWLSGNAASPVSVLMNEMRAHLEATDTDAAQVSKKNQTNRKFLQYSAATAKHGGLVAGAFAGLTGVGSVGTGANIGGKAGAAIAAVLEAYGGDKSSSKMKEEVAELIRDIDLRFLIVLDDLDRLEPNELVEAIRLVKSVGDLPNTIYLLCYDREVVATALQKSLGIENGFEYLEKIVQLSISIPLPEIFVLRRMLLDGLLKLYEDVHGCPPNADISQRLEMVVNHEGAHLSTPRNVKSVLNAVAFTYPEVRENVDYADYCWVHTLRTTRPQLHNLVERYMSVQSQVSTATAQVSNAEMGKFGEEFRDYFPLANGSFDIDAGTLLLLIVPGLGTSSGSSEPKDWVFLDVYSADDLAGFRKRRLASVSHWRYYFALAVAQDTWSEDEFLALSDNASHSVEAVIKHLGEISEREQRYGAASFSTFIRLYLRWVDETSEVCRNSLLAIANIMDDLTPKRTEFGLGIEGQIGFAVIEKVRAIDDVNPSSGQKLINEMLLEGKSLHWLFSWLFGRHVHDHGLIDGKIHHPNDMAMDAAQTKDLIDPMVDRIKSAEADGSLWNFPRLGSVLSLLNGLDGPDSVFDMVERSTASDDHKFLKLLDGVRGTVSSNAIYHPITDHSLSLLFRDAEAAEKRLRVLAEGNTKISIDAGELVEALEYGRRR